MINNLPNNSTQLLEVCELNELQEDSSKGYSTDDINLFLVKKDGFVHAYKNICPHLGIPLEMNEDQFLDCENTFIQCSTHGAIFNIEDGLCISGPCSNESLTPLKTEIIDNKIVVHIT